MGYLLLPLLLLVQLRPFDCEFDDELEWLWWRHYCLLSWYGETWCPWCERVKFSYVNHSAFFVDKDDDNGMQKLSVGGDDVT